MELLNDSDRSIFCEIYDSIGQALSVLEIDEELRQVALTIWGSSPHEKVTFTYNVTPVYPLDSGIRHCTITSIAGSGGRVCAFISALKDT